MGLLCTLGFHSWEGKSCKKCGAINKEYVLKLNTLLFDAVRDGDGDRIISAINDGADINATGSNTCWNGTTPLYHAARFKQAAILKLLLEKGADVNARNHNGERPLWGAVIEANLENLQLLVNSGADINAIDDMGKSVLFAAVASHNFSAEVVNYLLANGADINLADKSGNTWLVNYFFLIYGSKARLKDGSFMGTRQKAVEDLNKEISTLHTLLDLTKGKGLNVNTLHSVGQKKFTPLILAVRADEIEIVKKLLELGADISASEGLDTFIPAILNCSYPQIKELLIYKTKLNTLLFDAIKDGDADRIISAINDGADINATYAGCNIYGGWNGTTPLYHAARFKQAAILKLLLEKGADVNARNHGGERPLWGAIIRANLENLQLLVNSGADINARDDKGKSVLFAVASHNFNAEVVNYLLANGADINLADKSGNTWLVYYLFRIIGRKAELWDGSLMGTRQKAVEDLNKEISTLHTLLDLTKGKGLNVNTLHSVGQKKFTPLILAVRADEIEIVKKLLELGADVSASEGLDTFIPTILNCSYPQIKELLIYKTK